MNELQKLLDMAATGQGRIVSSGDLTPLQIAEAQANGRFAVTEDSLGWALVPWELWTRKDMQRELEYKEPAKS